MPSIYTNGNTPSHRRTLSSKSLNIKTTTTLSGRVQSHPKLSALGKKRNTEIELTGGSVVDGKDLDIDSDMSFHQYCTTCDKQILVPNSLLYCSESCRRKDSTSTSSPLELKLALRPTRSPTSPMATERNPFDIDNEDQLRLGPGLISKSLPAHDSKPPELHSHKPDLDPTEWKPNSIATTLPNNPVSAGTALPFVIPNLLPEEESVFDKVEIKQASETTVQSTTTETARVNATRPELAPRRQSAAFSYLAQFHRSASSFLSLANNSKHRSSSSIRSRATSVTRSHSEGSHETPAMSLDHSSRNSSSGCLSSAMNSEFGTRSIGEEEQEEERDGENQDDGVEAASAPDEGIMFGKEMIENVNAVALSSPVHKTKGVKKVTAEGSLRGLLAKA